MINNWKIKIEKRTKNNIEKTVDNSDMLEIIYYPLEKWKLINKINNIKKIYYIIFF